MGDDWQLAKPTAASVSVKRKNTIDSLIVFFMPCSHSRNNDDLAQDIYKNCIGLPVIASLTEGQ